MAHDNEKELAARASLDLVREGMVVGLGTGSTSECAIRLLAERIQGGLAVRCLASSMRSQNLGAELGIPITTLNECPELDIYIDGADEIDSNLQLIKGGGGALLREKILASAAKQFVVIADSSKQVEVLGNFPLPVEVVPFAEPLVTRKISGLGATVSLRKYAYGNPFVTDEGHHILDCCFGQIPNPAKLARTLADIPGVVENGLFVDMVSVVLIGKGTKVVQLSRPNIAGIH